MLHPGEPQGPDTSEAQVLAGLANTGAKQTWIRLSQDKPVIQEMRVWTGETGEFISGASSLGTWQAQALTDLPVCRWTPRVFWERLRGYVPDSRQRGCDHGCGAGRVQPMVMAGKRTWGGGGLPRISLLSRLICSRGWDVPVIAKHLHGCFQKVRQEASTRCLVSV